MKYCFDLDGTLCSNTNGEYENAQPFNERIQVVNTLFEQGNEIIIDSARGSTTKIDWHDFTFLQLKNWGIQFHKLRTGVKIDADIFIDDKGIQDILFFNRRIV
jgi:predicted ATPase